MTKKSRDRSWEHTGEIIFFNENDQKKTILIDNLAKIFIQIAKGNPIEIDFTRIPQLRDIILGQLKDEYPKDIFHMIAYKTKFVLYNSKSSSEVFFLTDNFKIDAVFKFKQGIRKVIAFNDGNPDQLSYIDNLYNC
jgi:hypothetical protein